MTSLVITSLSKRGSLAGFREARRGDKRDAWAAKERIQLMLTGSMSTAAVMSSGRTNPVISFARRRLSSGI